MDRLSEKIVGKIKEEKVKPKPRWHFMVMHLFLISTIVLSIIFGSMAFAVIIRKITLTDWELARLSAGGSIRPIIQLLPYLWFIFVILAIFIADRLFKKTKTGHRRKPWMILLGSVLLSMNFGYIFFITHFDQPFEKTFRNHLPYYQLMEEKQHGLFIAPEKGLLAGKIIEINTENNWMIIDFKRHEWLVDVSSAEFKTHFEPEIGLMVGIMGKTQKRGQFEATVVEIWEKPVMMEIRK